MMARLYIWVAAMAATMVLASPATAQSAAERRIMERTGMLPAATRAVFDRVDDLQAQIQSLSSANGIQSRTLRAIALELGARNPNLSRQQFLDLIAVRAGNAAETNRQISELAATISSLDPGGERRRAAALLDQARMAFNEGRLEDAQASFAQLSFLRSSELAQAHSAWLAAIDLQAQSASLRGDTDGATQIRLAKMAEIRSQRVLAEREELLTAVAIAEDWQARGDNLADNAAFVRSIGYYRDLVLPLVPREHVPLDWAIVQSNLGNALTSLGQRNPDTAVLDQAVNAYRLALEVQTRERSPLAWANTQNGLANALRELGKRENGTARLTEALAALRLALLEFTRETSPLDWAMAQNNVGSTLRLLSEREGGTAHLEEALIAFRLALEVRTRQRSPRAWAATQTDLGSTYFTLGVLLSDRTRLDEALVAYRLALDETPRESAALDWASTQNNIGSALMALGELSNGTSQLEEAAATYRLALEEATRERVPLEWAATQNNLGNALGSIGGKLGRSSYLVEAIAVYHLALEERTIERDPFTWVASRLDLAGAMAMLSVLQRDSDMLAEAEAVINAARRVAVSYQYHSHLRNADSLVGLIRQERQRRR